MSNLNDGHRKFAIGTTDYEIQASVEGDHPPEYKLVVSSQVPAGQSEEELVIRITGKEAHMYIQNRDLLEKVTACIEAAFKGSAKLKTSDETKGQQ